MRPVLNSINMNFTKIIINHGIIDFNPKSKISFIRFNHNYIPIHQITSIIIYDSSKFKHGTEIQSLTSNEYHKHDDNLPIFMVIIPDVITVHLTFNKTHN